MLLAYRGCAAFVDRRKATRSERQRAGDVSDGSTQHARDLALEMLEELIRGHDHPWSEDVPHLLARDEATNVTHRTHRRLCGSCNRLRCRTTNTPSGVGNRIPDSEHVEDLVHHPREPRALEDLHQPLHLVHDVIEDACECREHLSDDLGLEVPDAQHHAADFTTSADTGAIKLVLSFRGWCSFDTTSGCILTTEQLHQRSIGPSLA